MTIAGIIAYENYVNFSEEHMNIWGSFGSRSQNRHPLDPPSMP